MVGGGGDWIPAPAEAPGGGVELDGPGALRRIRSQGGPNDATPILAFTGDVDDQSVRELMAKGFQDVVAKPVEPAVLIDAVARAVAFMFDPVALEANDAG